MEPWRLIVDACLNGPENMSRDEALLINAPNRGTPALRFYLWSEPTVTIGYNQKQGRGINMDWLSAHDIPVIRRPTGGRAVYHNTDLTCSVAIPRGHDLFRINIVENYNLVAGALTDGFRRMGLDAEVVGPSRSPEDSRRYADRASCFAVSLGHEISVGGRKLVGTAGRITRDGVLQQGTILMNSDEPALSRVFPGMEANCRAGALQLLSKPIEIDMVINELIGGFRRNLNIAMEESELDERERSLTGRLLGKYSSKEWNQNGMVQSIAECREETPREAQTETPR